jgi:hypothetical protein
MMIVKSTIFWDVMPCSSVEVSSKQSLGCCQFHASGLLGLHFGLKMEAECSPKLVANFYWTIWHHIPEDRALERGKQT